MTTIAARPQNICAALNGKAGEVAPSSSSRGVNPAGPTTLGDGSAGGSPPSPGERGD
ncbi:hypothetical protein [Rhodococcus sp. IEGM 1408]|uniref:hypothetical protein n=1 Tax=Rhodococcus sp. IEGM 1408 TaxID=3082220 RepID=UPI0029530B62|nr:hypothetical protein [Rhodococcus sp. IEGM 1408]MDV7999981.1 hypothetical protein [Rhodococcus sp. IEGM 1408]